MRQVSQKEIQAVLALDAAARYRRFVKVVVDTQEAWGLWDEGWATYADDAGALVFPLWPALEYADLCRSVDWASLEPKPIELADLLDELLRATNRVDRGAAAPGHLALAGEASDLGRLDDELRARPVAGREPDERHAWVDAQLHGLEHRVVQVGPSVVRHRGNTTLSR